MNTDTVKKIMPLCLLLIITSGGAYTQPKNRVIDYSAIQPSAWIIPQNDTLAYSFETYSGRKKALILKRNLLNYKSANIAYPKALEFKDGIIDLGLKKGSVGFWLGNSAKGAYKNLRITTF
ncbi:MAG: hypothetical protein JWM28_3338 [Chitinophagaceae bacterium]|nr:hypothetical protein [Chitinophagaceae bacterium]